MNHPATTISESRSLMEAEQNLLRWLLTRGADITGTDAKLAAAFLPQVEAVQVVGRCSCGCPSIDLAVTRAELAVPGAAATLADVEGQSPEGTDIGVILRAVGGMLAEMELYSRDGSLPFSIPAAEQLKAFW